MFYGSLRSGDKAVFRPIAWNRWETPRLLLIYGGLSRTVNIQKFYGVFHDNSTYFAVMEDLDSEDSPFVLLQNALSNGNVAQASRIQRLRLCYELALTVAYLHSVNIVVKVISESSFYVRDIGGELIPILTNLEHARLVYRSICISALTNLVTFQERQLQL